MKISLFKNVSEVKNPEILDLIDYLIDTQEGKWEDIVTHCRNLKTKEERDEYKKTMPTASLSGVFSYRNDESLSVHSEVLAMDLDYVENLNIVKGLFKKDKYVFACFMSTGGYGLRVLFRIEPSKHKLAFKSLCQYIWENYGIACDRNSSLSKPYCVSFDPDLYLAAEYEQVPVYKKYIKETVVKSVPSYIHNNEDFENVFHQITGRGIDICSTYDDWIKVGYGIAEQFGESGRYYFHALSRINEKYNYKQCEYQYSALLKSRGSEKINIRSFYYLAKSAGVNIVSEKTKEVIRTTKNGKRAGLKVEQIITNLKDKGGIEGLDQLIHNVFSSTEKEDFEDTGSSIIHSLEMFIQSNYTLRFNEISGFFEDKGNVITPTIMNSIYISAKKVLDKLDYNLMIKLLKSDFTPSYNPLFEFFGSDGIPVILPATPTDNGQRYESPLIDKLSSCIINENEAYTRYFLRKWLVSIVSSAHKVHSPLLFCLLGEQHTGKTEFFRRLMPDDLKPYYAESKLDKEKDDELLMTENLIIMDDELGGKSKQDALKLKNITSKQWFSLRRPYGDHNEKILRLAVLCGTSNYKQILSDPTGNRRIIPVEVLDIDKEKYNSINKKDLFMEMFRLYKEGFDWRILPSDLKLLNKDEEKYTTVIREKDLIIKYFAPGGDNDERMSTTDIQVELEKITGQKLSSHIIGREMEAMGFQRRSTRIPESQQVRLLWRVTKIGREKVEAWKPDKTYSNGQDVPKDDLPF